MKNLKCFLLLSLLLLTLSEAESKTQKVLPKEFTGIWVVSKEACISIENTNDFDKALVISPTSWGCYESSCDIQQITKFKNHSLKVEAICSGEGVTDKEIFHMKLLDYQTISLRRIAINGEFDSYAETWVYHRCDKLKEI
jgi:hypothetical protein